MRIAFTCKNARILFIVALTFSHPIVASGEPISGRQVREATGIDAGIAVHFGTTDARLETELLHRGRVLVHGLALTDETLAQARQAIAKTGKYGLASVVRAPGNKRLPYANDLVNLFVADIDALGEQAPAMNEILRVLRPHGAVYLKQGGKWTTTVKPMPDQTDEWPQWDYSAAGNPASQDTLIRPTTALRWYAGPSVAHHGATKVGARLAGGRMVYAAVDYGFDNARLREERKRDIVARDAFNGLLLWKRHVDGVASVGDSPGRFGLTAADNRVFAYVSDASPLHALDAETGETTVTFDAGPPMPTGYEKWSGYRNSPEEIHFVVRVLDGKVVQAYRNRLTVSDSRTGKLGWEHEADEDTTVGWVVAAERKVFAVLAEKKLLKNRASPLSVVKRVVAFDLDSGKVLWENDQARGRLLFRMVYHESSLIVPTMAKTKKIKSGGPWIIARLNAADGKTIWKTEEISGGWGHYTIVMVRAGEVFLGQEAGFAVRFDNGEFLRKVSWSQHDNSCADLRCVPNYTFYGLTFIDREGERITRGQARSICDTGNFPAYGMMYGLPSACLCAEYINGHYALSSEPVEDAVDDAERLIVHAADAPDDLENQAKQPADEWPMHMANPRRGSWTPRGMSVNDAVDLKIAWQIDVAPATTEGPLPEDWRDNEQIVGPISAPTVAAGKVFIASPDAHRVDAFDAVTGKHAWSFTAGARIDTPPTINRGLCLFGCRDGFVYCLRAADGKLSWRFLAARTRKQIAVQSQLESAWPVFGSVVIHQGGAVVTAGRHSAVDGGIHVYKLEPATGRLLWSTRLWTDPDITRTEKWQWRNRRCNDLLVSNGRQLCLWITPLANGYQPGELVDVYDRIFPARAVRFYSGDRRKEDLADATWLWAANSSGLTSRREKSVGRFDGNYVNYADLNARRIVIGNGVLYALDASRGQSKEYRGGLIRAALDKDGRLAHAPDWKSDGVRYSEVRSMIGAGDRLFITCDRPGNSSIQIRSTTDGENLGEAALPAPAVKDGVAAAYGRLYVACQDGRLVCLKP